MTIPNPTRSIKTVVKITMRGERVIFSSVNCRLPISNKFLRSLLHHAAPKSEFPNRKSPVGNRALTYLLRRESARSAETAPPPEISNASAIASSARGYSKPLLLAKNLGQWTPITAVSITQAIAKAPTRVNRPRKPRAPPTNSERAAAANHNQAGLMKGNGVLPEIQALNPDPPKVPNTFCEP